MAKVFSRSILNDSARARQSWVFNPPPTGFGCLEQELNKLLHFCSKGIRVGDATIISQDLPASNGIIHVIDQVQDPDPNPNPSQPRQSDVSDPVSFFQVLIPSLADLPPEPPSLMAFLNSSSNFTLFREYALVRCTHQTPQVVFFSRLFVSVCVVFLCRCTICRQTPGSRLITRYWRRLMTPSGNTSAGPTRPSW